MKLSTRSLLTAAAAVVIAAPAAGAAATTYYDAVPDPLPSNVASLGYYATTTSEFGQLVEPATTGPLNTATLTMSSWACETGQWQDGDCTTSEGATFDHDITLNFYEVDNSGTQPETGLLLGSVTQTVVVPYRPSVDTDNGCATGWYAADFDRCTDGYAFNATFDLSSMELTLPSEMIVGIAYETGRDGLDPGGYNALNVGLTSDEPSIGTAGDIFWNGILANGDLTPGVFDNDGDWGYNVAISLGYAETGPATADDCKDGGYESFGFRNQGQCVASVKASEQAGK